ncbi:MAG: hypothetical protein VW258_15015, partial [Thalassolituus sp.]
MFKKLLIPTALVLVSIPQTHAETAQIQVAERNCTQSTSSNLNQTLGSRWSGVTTEGVSNNTRGNLSDSLCTATDVQTWITNLQASCTTYFDIISITPLTKGHAEISYYTNISGTNDYDSRSAGFGYSYTDR